MAFRIENGVLKKCWAINDAEITIPDSVTSIGEDAFADRTSLKSIIIPDSVTSIGDRAFSNCESLKSITIPDSITSIGNEAFYWCNSLTEITIPDNVTSIGINNFEHCTSLKSINVSEKNTNFCSCNGVLYNKDMTILIKYPASKEKAEFIIPDSVTSIGGSAFAWCERLISIIIPDSVASIDKEAFYCCKSLISIKIPESVASISYCAFYGCKSLENIIIPDGVKSICSSAFESCENLKSITLPDSIQSIGGETFKYCTSLTDIIIPDSVKNIGNQAFYNCESLTDITIPDNVASIGLNFFSCQNLKAINVSDKNKHFCSRDGVLYNKDMTMIIKYPQAKQEKEFIIPESVTSIEKDAFEDCTNLASITIHNNIKSIGNSAFSRGMKIILCKDDVKIPLTILKGTIAYRYEPLLNKFIVADLNDRQQYFDEMKPYYKIPLALFMASAYPQETYYPDYLKNNAEDAVKYLIDEECIDLLYRFLEFGFVTEKNIDSLISYAVEHTQNGGSAEPQIVLSKYKSDNFGSKGADAFDKFML